MKRFFLYGLLVLMVLLAGVSAFAAFETGQTVDFELERLDGGTSKLSDFRGQWVILNYWATWCAPCRKEIPELSEIHNQREDISVLGLAFEDLDRSEFVSFLEEFHVSYPILLVDVYNPPEPFGAPRVLPTTIILEPDGTSARAFAGPVTREQIESFIDGWDGHE